jgi:hypothetical protein
MKNVNHFVELFKKHMRAALEEKTGWGKVEVYERVLESINRAYGEMLEIYGGD